MSNIIQVSELDVAEFDISVALAIRRQSSEPLTDIEGILERLPKFVESSPAERKSPAYFYRADGCLVVSFDLNWRPYLDNTVGYNQPGSLRWYVPKNKVLKRVADAMKCQGRQISGGRAFLHEGGAAYGEGNRELLRWRLAAPSQYLKPHT